MNQDHAEWVSELSEKHGRMVFSTAYRILGNAQDAEDVLQEVFLKILGGWWTKSRSDSIQDWGAYLRVTASRCAIDLLRRTSRGKTENWEFIEDTEHSGQINPRCFASEKQKAHLLRRAIAQLPERDAGLFALRYFEDFSYEEIAAQLNLSVNQVGVILHRSREKLKEILAPYQSVHLPAADRPVRIPSFAKENLHEQE